VLLVQCGDVLDEAELRDRFFWMVVFQRETVEAIFFLVLRSVQSSVFAFRCDFSVSRAFWLLLLPSCCSSKFSKTCQS
jgi:hypothetical protein